VSSSEDAPQNGGGLRPDAPSDEQPVVIVPDTDSYEAAKLARMLGGEAEASPADAARAAAAAAHAQAERPSWPPIIVRPEALESDVALRPVGADTDEIFPPPDLPLGDRSGDLDTAFDQLEIRTPPEELEAYARARVEALVRTGQGERAQRLDAARGLALAAVRRAMGATPREAP
jgi:hypothetical protein